MNEITSLGTTEIKVTAVEKSIEIEPQSGLTLEEAKEIWELNFSSVNIETPENEFGGKYNSYEESSATKWRKRNVRRRAWSF